MSSSPFRNILLPTVLVSGTVFSALLITFMVHRPQPKAIDQPDSDTEVTQYISSKESKDAMIRYVGFSVIVSVGVGVSVIEGLRKWRSFWESPQDKAKQFGLEHLLQGDIEVAPLELEPAIEDASVQLSNTEPRPTEVFSEVDANNLQETDVQVSFRETFQLQELENSVAASVLEPVFEQPFLDEIEDDAGDSEAPQISTQLAAQEPLTLSNMFEQPMFEEPFLDEIEDDADDSEAPQTSTQLAVQEPLTLPILDLNQATQTSQIKVLHSEKVRFACLFEGKYYCFVRAEKTKNQAFKTAALLADEGNQPMITAIKQGYAVWTWEPTAIVEPIA